MRKDINPRMVAGIILEVNEVLKRKGFTQPEVVLALQEMVGRVIVDMCGTAVQGGTMVDIAKKHLDDTCAIGFATKGQSLIARV